MFRADAECRYRFLTACVLPNRARHEVAGQLVSNVLALDTYDRYSLQISTADTSYQVVYTTPLEIATGWSQVHTLDIRDEPML
jgi:hypothetical protein